MDNTEYRVTLTFARPEGIGLYAAEDILAAWLRRFPAVQPVMGWDPETRTTQVTLTVESSSHDAAVADATARWTKAWRADESRADVVASSVTPTSLDR